MNEYGEYFIYGSGKYDKEHPDKPKNIKGCINNGIPKETARLIWDKMVKFAAYAFNKSHATCYAALGAKTAWLACNFPVEHMTGILNSYISDNKKLAKYVCDCSLNHITLLAPDINLSDIKFKTVSNPKEFKKHDKAIIFGLAGINGVGPILASAIVNERNKNGSFKSVIDFLERMVDKKLDKASLESLIKTGAFDCFPGTRASKLDAFDQMLTVMKAIKKDNKNQLSLFDTIGMEKYAIDFKDIPEFTRKKISEFEYNLLGYYVNHPLYDFSKKIERWKGKGMLITVEEISNLADINKLPKNAARVAGVVKDKEISDYFDKRKNSFNQLLKFEIDDGSGSLKCVAFGNDAVKFSAQITNGSVVYLLGNLKSDDFGISCMINQLYVFDENDKN